MSFDLAVMSIGRDVGAEAAAQIYRQMCDGNYGILPPSEGIDAFYRELIGKYSDVDSYPDDEVDDCPWSVGVDDSAGAVMVNIVWSRAEEVAPFVMRLAAAHGLACYDPQEERLWSPPPVPG